MNSSWERVVYFPQFPPPLFFGLLNRLYPAGHVLQYQDAVRVSYDNARGVEGVEVFWVCSSWWLESFLRVTPRFLSRIPPNGFPQWLTYPGTCPVFCGGWSYSWEWFCVLFPKPHQFCSHNNYCSPALALRTVLPKENITMNGLVQSALRVLLKSDWSRWRHDFPPLFGLQ